MKYSRLATILSVTIVGATSLSLVLADPEKPKRKVSKKALQSTTRSVKPAVTTKSGATAKPGASDNRSARNIRTGQAIKVKATSVPAFRPGAGFDAPSPPPSPPPPPPPPPGR